MIDARSIITSVFKALYLSGLREIRLQQTEFSIYLVEQLSSIQFVLGIPEGLAFH